MYRDKYLKYKQKYFNLKKLEKQQTGGGSLTIINITGYAENMNLDDKDIEYIKTMNIGASIEYKILGLFGQTTYKITKIANDKYKLKENNIEYETEYSYVLDRVLISNFTHLITVQKYYDDGTLFNSNNPQLQLYLQEKDFNMLSTVKNIIIYIQISNGELIETIGIWRDVTNHNLIRIIFKLNSKIFLIDSKSPYGFLI